MDQVGVHLILYDGVCGLCNRLNTFVLPRDPSGTFDFAPLQSDTARRVLAPFNRNPDDLNTLFVIANYKSTSPAPTLLSKARAALFVIRTLGFPWSLLGIFGILPTFLLDIGYDAIASRRYRLFGRYEQCLLPSVEYRKRFIAE